MIIALALLASASCVSRNNHELVVMQLDATRTALSAHQADSRGEASTLLMQIKDLEKQIHSRQMQLDALADRDMGHIGELRELQLEYAELLSIASTPPECPVPPPPTRRRRPKTPPVCPPWEVEPMVLASVEQMKRALAHEAQAEFAEGRVAERHQRLIEQFAPLVEEGWVTVERRGEASVVTLPAAKLFQEGRVMLSPRGDDILQQTADALSKLHGREMSIRGHTDNSAFHSAELASNWELGFARSALVLRVLRDMKTTQPAHAESWADTKPIGDNDTEEGRKRNHRVELWLTEIEGLEERFDPTPDEPKP